MLSRVKEQKIVVPFGHLFVKVRPPRGDEYTFKAQKLRTHASVQQSSIARGILLECGASEQKKLDQYWKPADVWPSPRATTD
jgi:hypothetical protein